MGEKVISDIQAVVFDLDDTLYPEMDYVRSGYRAVAGRLARPGWDADRIYEMMWEIFDQGDRRRVFNEVLKRLGEPDEEQIIAELIGVYRCHRPVLGLEVEVCGVLEELKGRYKLGLITDGYLPSQKLKVEALGIGQMFDRIIYTEELGREFWKPSLKAFEMMTDDLGVDPEQCVYVGDNPGKDFVGPNRLRWWSVQIVRGDRVPFQRDAVEGGSAKKVIDDITLLCGLLS